MRADNCAFNSQTGDVRMVDWNWVQIGDRNLDMAEFFTNVARSGFVISDEFKERLNPVALRWMAGIWFDSAATPIWEGGPDNLREHQLLSGVMAMRLSEIVK